MEANRQAEPADTLNWDIPCRRCGYNLRGLPNNGCCPECHLELSRSLLGDDLRVSDRDWIIRLASGFDWLCLGVIVGAGFLLGTLAARLFGQPIAKEARLMFSVLVATLAVIGIWKLTTPDPAGDEKTSTRRARIVLWIWVVGSMVLQVVGDLGIAIPWPTMMVMRLAQVVLGVVGVFVFFNFARHIAKRMDDRLSDDTCLVMWGVAASYLLFIGMVAAAAAPGKLPDGFQIIFGLSCTVVLGCIVFSIWSFTLLWRYRTMLRQIARAIAMKEAKI